MRVSKSNESQQIKVNNGELKEFNNFKSLGSVLTRGGYCTREIKMRNAIAKEAFNRKIYLFDMQAKPLNSGRSRLGVMLGALLYMAQRPGH